MTTRKRLADVCTPLLDALDLGMADKPDPKVREWLIGVRGRLLPGVLAPDAMATPAQLTAARDLLQLFDRSDLGPHEWARVLVEALRTALTRAVTANTIDAQPFTCVECRAVLGTIAGVPLRCVNPVCGRSVAS